MKVVRQGRQAGELQSHWPFIQGHHLPGNQLMGGRGGEGRPLRGESGRCKQRLQCK